MIALHTVFKCLYYRLTIFAYKFELFSVIYRGYSNVLFNMAFTGKYLYFMSWEATNEIYIFFNKNYFEFCFYHIQPDTFHSFQVISIFWLCPLTMKMRAYLRETNFMFLTISKQHTLGMFIFFDLFLRFRKLYAILILH